MRGELVDRIEASGRIEADERSLRKVAVRAAGWVEVLNVRAEGDPVKQGQTLAEVYSPSLDAAQREFLLALESGQSMLLDAARDKLRALGFDGEDIARLERDRRTIRRVAVRSPMHGYVMRLSTREGAAIVPDVPLFELVGHDPLWVLVNLPESQSASVAIGSNVQVRAEAFPGQTFEGTIDYLYPELDMGTRTRRARIVLDNPADALHPGMFVDVSLSARLQGGVLLVPSEAVIRTGHRDVVIVATRTRRLSPGACRRRRRARRHNRHRVGSRRRRPRGDVGAIPHRFGSEPAWRVQPHAGRRSQQRSGAMIAAVIRWSVANRLLVLLATAILVAWGLVARVAHAARRHSRSVRRAGDRPHHVSRPGARRSSRIRSLTR